MRNRSKAFPYGQKAKSGTGFEKLTVCNACRAEYNTDTDCRGVGTETKITM